MLRMSHLASIPTPWLRNRGSSKAEEIHRATKVVKTARVRQLAYRLSTSRPKGYRNDGKWRILGGCEGTW